MYNAWFELEPTKLLREYVDSLQLLSTHCLWFIRRSSLTRITPCLLARTSGSGTLRQRFLCVTGTPSHSHINLRFPALLRRKTINYFPVGIGTRSPIIGCSRTSRIHAGTVMDQEEHICTYGGNVVISAPSGEGSFRFIMTFMMNLSEDLYYPSFPPTLCRWVDLLMIPCSWKRCRLEKIYCRRSTRSNGTFGFIIPPLTDF